MDSHGKVGRNDPCPCGSGKKFKKCCGAPLPTGMSKSQTDNSIRFNREIAYLGGIGRRREAFCRHYQDHKQKLFNALRKEQENQANKRGQTISCHKGCAFCCNELVSASLGECELIVFYLYHHEEVLNAFVRAFPVWLEQVKRHPDIFKRIEEAREKTFANRMSSESRQELGEQLHSYWEQQIQCPFLLGNECSIYEVRPWGCGSVFSVTPAEWCDPLAKKEPKIYWTKMPPNILVPFYDDHSSITPPDRYMPDTTYRILVSGFRFFSEIPGLESLYQEVLHDSEIISFVQSKRWGAGVKLPYSRQTPRER